MKKRLFICMLLAITLVLGGFTVTANAAKLTAPDVKVTNVASTGKIKLTWDKVDAAAKYKVYRATSKDGSYSLLKTTTSTSFINTSTTAGKTYYYYVRSVSKSDEVSGKSNVVKRMCDLPRPESTVSNVASSGKIKVSWKSIDGAVKYEVHRATSKDGTYSKMMTTTNTSYTNTSANVGKTYYYKVKAIASNSSANSAFSLMDYRTCDCERPVIKTSYNSDGYPKVTWSAVSGAKKYEIYRSKTKSSGYSLLQTVKGTSFTNTSAASGTKYYYKVKAIAEKSAANSAYSLPKYITTKKSGETLKTRYVYQPSLNLYVDTDDNSKKKKIPYMTEVKRGAFVREGADYGWCRIYYKGDRYYTYIPNDTLIRLTSKKSSYSYDGKTTFQDDLIEKAMYIHDNWNTYYAHKKSTGKADSDGRYGFDCSGFASYLLDETMQPEVPVYDLSKSIETLYNTSVIYNEGLRGECKAKVVSFENIQPGDVIFFDLDTTKGVDHCGIYMGNEEFMHSTEAWDGVCISPLRGMYKENLIKIKRYLPTSVLWAKVEKRMNVTWSGLRATPDYDASVKTELGLGDLVTVRFVGKSSDWSYVVTESGKKGYVLNKYLTNAEEMEPLNQKRTINVTWTGLRSKADDDLALTKKLAQGETVTLLYIGGDWGYVKTSDGSKGYVLMKYLDK